MTGSALPESMPDGRGPHGAHHAALKADYDIRHPDDPLPEFDGGRVHIEIHNRLNIDYNLRHDGPTLPTEIVAGNSGHLAEHNTLHADVNARNRP